MNYCYSKDGEYCTYDSEEEEFDEEDFLDE